MNRIFGIPQTAVALVAIAVAIVLVVIAGLILVGSAAIRALMLPGLKLEGVSLLALLVTIIVLLAAVFVLLLVVFRCCCQGRPPAGKDGAALPDPIALLLPLQPLLLELPNLLRDSGVAIYEVGKTLSWISDNFSTVSDKFNALASNASIRVPHASFDHGDLYFFEALFKLDNVNPLADVQAGLQAAANSISPNSMSVTLGTPAAATVVTLPAISQNLIVVGQSLARIAAALNATPQPPTLP